MNMFWSCLVQNLATHSYQNVTFTEEGQTKLHWFKQTLRTPAPSSILLELIELADSNVDQPSSRTF